MAVDNELATKIPEAAVTSEVKKYTEDTEVRNVAVEAIGSEIRSVKKQLRELPEKEQEKLMNEDPHIIAVKRLDGLSRLTDANIADSGTEGYKIGDNGNKVMVRDDQEKPVRVLSIIGAEKSGDDIIFTCRVEGSNVEIKRNKKVVMDAHLVGNKDTIATSPPFSPEEVRILHEHIAAIDPELSDEQKSQLQLPGDDKKEILEKARAKTAERIDQATPPAEVKKEIDPAMKEADRVIAEYLQKLQAKVSRNEQLTAAERTLLSQLPIVQATQGEWAAISRRGALNAIGAEHPDAIHAFGDLQTQASEALDAFDESLRNSNISKEQITEFHTLLQSPDGMIGLLNNPSFLALADNADVDFTELTKNIFGGDITKEKLVEMLKKAGKSDKEISQMMQFAKAGGVGLLGLIALLVMGQLAASAELAKSLKGR